ncbi:MAG TPA: hypothetical protein VFI54_09270 [Solirubrobacteraceae bacterium]|nr:hypothetical protein [Solirubrobacteraceae bacterium]
MLAEVPTERFDAYLRTERRVGERYLGDTGRVERHRAEAATAAEARTHLWAVRRITAHT